MSTDLYKATVERFARELRAKLGPELHAVVLYGSVARGEARAESDIDVLVVVDDPRDAFDVTGEIAYELNVDSGFRTLLVPIERSPDQLHDGLRGGDPFLEEVLEEGKVIYDDGTLKRVRRQVARART